MNNTKLGFTFVELIVVVTILGILSTLGFISYTSSLGDARDGTRLSDIAAVASALKQYKQSRGSYPIPSPGDNFGVYAGTIGSNTGAIQGTMNNSVTLATLDNVPQDPQVSAYYSYAITPNRQEYQLAATLENGDTPLAVVQGDYSSVTKNILPTILIASNTPTDISSATGDNTLFIFNDQIHNLPYDFTGDNIPVSNGTDLIDLLSQAEADGTFWQNSDFQSCDEIQQSGKITGSGTYQVINPSTGILEDIGC